MKTYSPRSGAVLRKSKPRSSGPRSAAKLRTYSPPNGPAGGSGRLAINPFHRRRGSNAPTEPRAVLELSADGTQALISIDPSYTPYEWRSQHCSDGMSWGVDFPNTFDGSSTALMVDTLGLEYVRIRGFDSEGNPVTDYSNALFVLLPPPVLTWDGETSVLDWTWGNAETTDPVRWNIWQSTDGGFHFFLVEGNWTAGSARTFSPDGVSEIFYVVGVDANGNEVTMRSNRSGQFAGMNFAGTYVNSPASPTTIDDGSTMIAISGVLGAGTFTFSGGQALNELGDLLSVTSDNDSNPLWGVFLQDNSDMFWSESWNPLDPSGSYNARNNSGPTLAIGSLTTTAHPALDEDQLSWTDNSGGEVTYFVTGPLGEVYRGTGSSCTSTPDGDGRYSLYAALETGDVFIGAIVLRPG